jgi:hypothetical protein
MLCISNNADLWEIHQAIFYILINAKRYPPANILPNAYIGKKADAIKNVGCIYLTL